jgi:hypothetical protein
MQILKGQVVGFDEDGPQDGIFYASFPKLKKDAAFPVVYTSPYYRNNAGGMIAIPQEGSHILAVYNDSPEEEEHLLYYHSTIVAEPVLNNYDKEALKHVNTFFKNVRDNDSKAKVYGSRGKPVTQTFTNDAGAGLYIQREYAAPQISDSVTIKQQLGSEVNVGSTGVQIRNEQGDHISLNAMGMDYKGTDAGPARSLIIETRGPQEMKCLASDVNIRVIDGGDINIENNSTGFASFGAFAPGIPSIIPGAFPWSGNIRLKSRYRNIDLAALGDFSHVNIITKGAQIQVDSLGAVKIVTAGSIDFAAGQDINMTAGGSVNIVGNLGAQIGTTGGVAQVNGPSVSINNQTFAFNAGPPGSDYTNSIPVVGVPATPAVPPVIVPNDYADPAGGAV